MTSNPYVKQAPKVTYEDFVHSMTDRPQYFAFFLNKACGIAKNIGVKSFDHEELAIVAIEHLWSKIDKYDPSRAEFDSYFNTCIGNKIYDQIRMNNSEKVFGLNRTDCDDIDNYSDSISDEDEGKQLKMLDFADKMIVEFKKFIDTLSPEKRSIFCQSEFGRLAMGELPSDRNYSNQIAAQTGRTAAAVRKIVERLRKEAIGYVKERGFDYASYSTHVEFLTTNPIHRDAKVDFSALDWTALSGVQRLKVRMYLYEKAVEDGIIDEE